MTRLVSVVTGGAGGMGRECAARFVAAGDLVVLVDVDGATTQAAAAALGPDVVPLAADITDPSTGPAIATAVADLGELRAIAHTAGLSPTMADAARILDVNLVGTVRLLDALDPLVVDGTVAVPIASQAGHLLGGSDPAIAALLAEPLADSFLAAAVAAGVDSPEAAYGWSKWAVQREVVRRAPSWGARGARIVSLSPGMIDTAMGKQEFAAQPLMATMVDMTPLGRLGTADEIAAVVDFLCSPAASFITGTDLLVDGGSTAQVLDQLFG
ncbi:MAG: SDR family oxidoreductase [Acidimicrobiales bacterium]|nr:SDR family oxidoreductase [Acidimicrobiales bacterium]